MLSTLVLYLLLMYGFWKIIDEFNQDDQFVNIDLDDRSLFRFNKRLVRGLNKKKIYGFYYQNPQ